MESCNSKFCQEQRRFVITLLQRHRSFLHQYKRLRSLACNWNHIRMTRSITASITTFGELHRMNSPIFELSANSLAEINAALLNLLHALNQANGVNWFRILERTGLRTATPLASPDTPAEQIFAAIPLTAKRILHRELHERTWTIIQQRFGLEQREQHTLEEIGKKLHFTQERTLQREKQALRVLQDIFLRQNYVGRRHHMHRCPNADSPICTTSRVTDEATR
jgi:hypothetical protein